MILIAALKRGGFALLSRVAFQGQCPCVLCMLSLVCPLEGFAERHLMLECPAMQIVRDRYPAWVAVLRTPCSCPVTPDTRQSDIVGVTHFVKDCFDLLGAAPDAHDDGPRNQIYVHQLWRLGRIIHSFMATVAPILMTGLLQH